MAGRKRGYPAWRLEICLPVQWLGYGNYQKISSWGFLVIVSFIIVAKLKMLKQGVKQAKRIATADEAITVNF
jgi:uncharacterized membrane protein YoaT (DUF817 family)